jgi:two-component system chemotaxis sensor kinase CheA
MAIPLELVTRLEEFPGSAIEKMGSEEVVQYRNSILPLVRLNRLLPERRRKQRHPQSVTTKDAPLQVVVYSDQDHNVGLVVERILDIVEEDVTKAQGATRDGIESSLVIQGRVTEILDLPGLVANRAVLRFPQRLTRKAKG